MIVAVSGGTSGVGAAIVQDGRSRGWTMKSGSRSTGLDVRQESSIAAFVGSPVDAAIACAGISRDTPFAVMDAPEVLDIMDTNLHGAFLLARAAIREGATAVLFIGSLHQLGAPGNAVYAASKAALVGLTRAMTDEYPHVRINVLVPGFVLTSMSRSLSAVAQARLRAAAPLGRAIDLSEVARAAMDVVVSPLRGRVVRVTGGLLETPV